MIKIPIPYSNPLSFFPSIASLPYGFMLHSGSNISDQGRYSYLGLHPFLTLTLSGNHIQIEKNGIRQNQNHQNFWEILSTTLTKYQIAHDPEGPPFQGGAVGFFGYELGRTSLRSKCPDAVLAFYDHFICFDHQTHEAFICGVELPHQEHLKSRMNSLKLIRPSKKSNLDLNQKDRSLQSNFTKAGYIQTVKRIQDYIKQGDIYQANLSQQFQTLYEGSDETLFLKVLESNPEPFTGYFHLPQVSLFSFSPESFLKIEGKTVTSRPIKGTRARSLDIHQDKLIALELEKHPKDKAELLMILDLVRNDLGKVCEFGSIHVKELQRVEHHPHVHHLVATVKGTLKSQTTHIDCIQASFPGGSITGAPKIRSMQIIEELEPERRHLYTGVFGYLGFNKQTELSIVIRNLTRIDNQIFFHTGAGIVADSNPELEYEETLAKGKHLFDTLQMNPAEVILSK